MIHVQQVTAAGSGRTLSLVYDVPPAGVARLIDVAERSPRQIDGTLPPLTLMDAHFDELRLLPALLPQLGGGSPTHAQVLTANQGTSREPRALTLLWDMARGDLERRSSTRWATLPELFVRGGQLVGVIVGREPLALHALPSRRIMAPTYHALTLIAPQITDPRLVRRLMRAARPAPSPLPAAA